MSTAAAVSERPSRPPASVFGLAVSERTRSRVVSAKVTFLYGTT